MKRFRMVLALTCLVALMVSANAFAVVTITGLGVNNSGALQGRGWTVNETKWGNGVSTGTVGLYTGDAPSAATGTAWGDTIATNVFSFVTPPIAPPSNVNQKALFGQYEWLNSRSTTTKNNAKASLSYNYWAEGGAPTAYGSALKPTDPNDPTSNSTYALDVWYMVTHSSSTITTFGFKMMFYMTGVGSRYVIYEPVYTHGNNVPANVWINDHITWNSGYVYVNVDSHFYVTMAQLYQNNYGNFKDIVDNNWPMLMFQIGFGTGPGQDSYLAQMSSTMLLGGQTINFGGAALRPGDANGDNLINLADLTILSANWTNSGGKVWADGDFTGDGNVNLADLTILSAAWDPAGTGNGAALSAGAVPLPSAFGAGLALLGLGLARRRR